jgi:hypothetical protein
MLLPALLAGAASAQTAPPRGYLAYLDGLENLADNPSPSVTSPLYPQVYPGMVGLRTPTATTDDLGTIFVTGAGVLMNEMWFMPSLPSPGASFAFVHHGELPADPESALPSGWDSNPCFHMDLHYTLMPDEPKTLNLEWETDIDRYTFALVQDNAVVGRMLREHHQVPDYAEFFVDHWVFFQSYDPPDAEGETAGVGIAPIQFATTTAWWENVLDNPPASGFWLYAQVVYGEREGSECDYWND